MKRLTVEVPATSANMGPGFDCVGLALSVYNRVEVEVLPGTACEVHIEGYGQQELSRGPDNLVLVAMRHLYAKVDRELPAIRLRQNNAIPLCSGLGSSAAAEIAGLVAANELLGRPFSPLELGRLALDFEDHPDNIIPALVGGLVIAVAEHTETGWHLQYRRLDPPPFTAVIATPSRRVETVESRRRLPDRYSRADVVYNLGRAALLVAALTAGDRECLATALRDKVHQPYRLPAVEGSAEVLQAARDAGAIGAVLSGSGPTVIALCDHEPERVAAAMTECWQGFGLTVKAYPVAPSAAGARVVG